MSKKLGYFQKIYIDIMEDTYTRDEIVRTIKREIKYYTDKMYEASDEYTKASYSDIICALEVLENKF